MESNNKNNQISNALNRIFHADFLYDEGKSSTNQFFQVHNNIHINVF